MHRPRPCVGGDAGCGLPFLLRVARKSACRNGANRVVMTKGEQAWEYRAHTWAKRAGAGNATGRKPQGRQAGCVVLCLVKRAGGRAGACNALPNTPPRPRGPAGQKAMQPPCDGRTGARAHACARMQACVGQGTHPAAARVRSAATSAAALIAAGPGAAAAAMRGVQGRLTRLAGTQSRARAPWPGGSGGGAGSRKGGGWLLRSRSSW